MDSVNQTRSVIPAVTHVDYSARIQTVNQTDNPLLYSLLTEFFALTGLPLLINTSFNVRGEPPVLTPQDAIRCFLATDMDYLAIGHVLLDKTTMPASARERARRFTFEKD